MLRNLVGDAKAGLAIIGILVVVCMIILLGLVTILALLGWIGMTFGMTATPEAGDPPPIFFIGFRLGALLYIFGLIIVVIVKAVRASWEWLRDRWEEARP